MSYRFLQSAYIWLIYAGLFIIPFLSLFVSSSMLFPYITGRNFSFRIITEVIFLLWVGLAVLNKEYLPRPSKLLWAVFAFMIIVGLADTFGANPYRSFFSNYERMEGFMMIIHLALYFLVLTSVFKSKKEWYWYFGTIILASLFVAFNGLLQRLGVYPSLQGGNRVDGTIGNPTYLAAYLMFVFYLCFLLFSVLKKTLFRYAFLAVALFELVIIYFTATRGVTLALLGGGMIFIVLYVLFVRAESEKERLFKKIAAAGLVFLIIMPIFFYLIKDTSFVQKSNSLGRLTHISLTEKTVKSRFMIWNMAWQGVKEKPILGWGQENFPIIFSKFYNPQLFDQEPWFDRSHDIVFDWLINAGFLGFLSYLSLFMVSFILLWQGVRVGVVSSKESIILFVALVSYFFQNIFVFDNFNTYYLFFGILAYINTYHYSLAAASPEVLKNTPKDKKELSRSLVLAVPKSLSVLVGLGVFVLIFIYFFSIKPLNQSRALINALRSGAEGVTALDVLNNFKKAFYYNSFGNSEVREQLAQFAMQVFNNSSVPQEQKREIAKFVVEEVEKQVKEIPGDVKYKLFLGNLYMVFNSVDPLYNQKAEMVLLEALKQSSTKQPVYFSLAQYYYNTGQAEKALEISQKAAELAPNYRDAQVNLAMISVYLHKNDLAEKVIKDIEELLKNDGPAKLEEFPKIINAYVAVKNYKKVAEFYEELIKIKPNEASFHNDLALSYARLGKIEDAIKEVEEAARLNPDTYGKQKEQLIEYIKSGRSFPD